MRVCPLYAWTHKPQPNALKKEAEWQLIELCAGKLFVISELGKK